MRSKKHMPFNPKKQLKLPTTYKKMQFITTYSKSTTKSNSQHNKHETFMSFKSLIPTRNTHMYIKHNQMSHQL